MFNKEFVDYLDKKFNSIDGRLDQMDMKFDKVLDGQDRIVKRLDNLEQENKVSTELYKKHDEKIESHEERNFALEAKS